MGSCNFCEEFSPHLFQLAKIISSFENISIGKLNCVNEIQLKEKYKIEEFPSLILFKNINDKFEMKQYKGLFYINEVSNFAKTFFQ
jgi:thiol-disulfide isomerase/thioredoxin